MPELHVIVVVLAVFSLCEASPPFGYFGFNGSPSYHLNQRPRCSLASKPCRMRAVIETESQDPEEDSRIEEMSAGLCSCPRHKPCSSDWEGKRTHVIVRELKSRGNMNMTLSMMFCDPVRPRQQRFCQRSEVALLLSGNSIVPTEVDSIQCRCPSSRPLRLQEEFMGEGFRLHQAYVCDNHMRRCSIRRRQACMVEDVNNHVTTYPCKCPRSYTCSQYTADQNTTSCQRSRQHRSG